MMGNKAVSGNAVVIPSMDLGPVPRFEWLDIDDLVVDERYQRRITADGNTHINKIVRHFHWSKFQPLTVTGPDASGDYPVVDGQHRLEACRRHGGILKVPCWIIEAPKIADQAASFVGINQERIRVTNVSVFWAQVAAGSLEAAHIKTIVDRAGIKIGRVGTGIQPPKTTVAIALLAKLAKNVGDDFVVEALKLMAEAQPEVENAFRAPIITAVTRICGLHGSYDRDRMVTVLSEMDFNQTIETARSFKKAMGGNLDLAVQAVIARAYNKGLRGGATRLPEA